MTATDGLILTADEAAKVLRILRRTPLETTDELELVADLSLHVCTLKTKENR